MSAIRRVEVLPATLRRELDGRLIASGFGNLVALSQWLHSKGHRIGKSALGEYALQQKRRHAAAVLSSVDPSTVDLLKLRAECVTAAAIAGTPKDELTRHAGDLLDWVLAPLA